jgi:hypothetical protein
MKIVAELLIISRYKKSISRFGIEVFNVFCQNLEKQSDYCNIIKYYDIVCTKCSIEVL